MSCSKVFVTFSVTFSAKAAKLLQAAEKSLQAAVKNCSIVARTVFSSNNNPLIYETHIPTKTETKFIFSKFNREAEKYFFSHFLITTIKEHKHESDSKLASIFMNCWATGSATYLILFLSCYLLLLFALHTLLNTYHQITHNLVSPYCVTHTYFMHRRRLIVSAGINERERSE